MMTPDKLYTAGDMVRIGCNECKGCSYCCQEMGESVVLTPFDICELTRHLGKSFDELMEDKIELYMTVAAQNFCQKITFILSKVFGKYFQKELNYIVRLFISIRNRQ